MSIVHKIGRRKTSVARVYVKPGAGNITVNGRDAKEYFNTEMLVYKVNQPFLLTETVGQLRCYCKRFRWWNYWSSRSYQTRSF